MSNSALQKQEFLEKWIKGLRVCTKNFNKKNTTTISDRKNAIKLSADVAMASTRKASTQWSRALISDVISRDHGTNYNMVEQIVGCNINNNKIGKKRALIACSKRIIRRSHAASRRVVPRSSAIAKRTSVLKKLVPGGQEMNEASLIKETLDYIVALRLQVDVMRRLADVAQTLDSSKIS